MRDATASERPTRGGERGATASEGRYGIRADTADGTRGRAELVRRRGLDNPAFGGYIARWQGRVVAALATMVTGETVGVYHVATLTGARRRGIAGNLVLYVLREARAAGCTLATLTATPEARHLYEQLGFRACGVIEQWMPSYRLTAELMGQTAGFGM